MNSFQLLNQLAYQMFFNTLLEFETKVYYWLLAVIFMCYPNIVIHVLYSLAVVQSFKGAEEYTYENLIFS